MKNPYNETILADGKKGATEAALATKTAQLYE